MRRTAELAERLDVRLHTHLAEDPDEDTFAGELRLSHHRALRGRSGGAPTARWVAHCIYPNDAEIARLGAAGAGVAHCPSSNMMIGGGGIAPVARVPRRRRAGRARLRRLGVDRLGVALDGGPQRAAPRAPARAARHRRARATRSRSRHAGRRRVPRPRRASSASSSVGAAGDLVCWPLEGIAFAGRDQRPGRGVAAVRPGRRAPHRRRGARWWSTTAPWSTAASTRCSRWHRRVAERFQAP